MNPVRAGSTSIEFPLWPRPFRPGAKVALVAPAGPLGPDRITLSEERCRSLGLAPVVYPSARLRSGFLAGPDEDRLRDLQSAFDDPAVDGVWALRGGYGSMRIVDRLDLRRQLRDPIPFVGFSDNTTLHVRHHALGIVSFHGPHPGGDFPPEAEAAFRRVLFSASPSGPLSAGPDDPAPRTLVPGQARGRLFGGNLATLAALCGGSDRLDGRGHILFLEDLGEPAYRVDRMLTQLARAGVLDGISGLAFGRFTDCPDGQDDAVAEVLRETAQRVGVPAVADLPFGHVAHNLTLPVGGPALLDADGSALVLEAP